MPPRPPTLTPSAAGGAASPFNAQPRLHENPAAAQKSGLDASLSSTLMHAQQTAQQSGAINCGLDAKTSQMLRSVITAMAQACCDSGCLEVSSDGRIINVLSSHAYGFTADGLRGYNIGNISFEVDQQPLLHAIMTLAATTAATNMSSGQGAGRSLRVLHRMLYWNEKENSVQPTWIDTIIQADSSTRLMLCSRSALPGCSNAFNDFRFL